MKKLILSLYDYSGNWCKPYREAGYEVIQVDKILNGIDVRLMKYISSREVYGILAATPCNKFSQIRKVPDEIDLIDGLSCADAVLRMVVIYKPKFYCIENPAKSRLWHYIGKPKQVINLGWFGFETVKPTGLYGNFNTIPGLNYYNHAKKIKRQANAFQTVRHENRSTTPIDFANAFFLANP